MQIANANICIKNRNSCFEAKRNQDSIPYQIVYGFETVDKENESKASTGIETIPLPRADPVDRSRIKIN